MLRRLRSKDSAVIANGETTLVTRASSITLTPSLSLHHTLLVHALSNNLLSISQVTEQLDCVVLMFPTFRLYNPTLLVAHLIGPYKLGPLAR